MSNLKKQVASSASRLQSLCQTLSGRAGNLAIPVACYKRWEDMAALYASLLGTISLFDIRDNAWRVVESLTDPTRIEVEKKANSAPQAAPTEKTYDFSHDGIRMDFANARHLTLVSYVSVAWSIYDRLANVCGRLAATDEVRQHYKQNPKLVEDLLAKSKDRPSESAEAGSDYKQNKNGRYEYGNQLFAFSMQHHLRSAYDWPTRVSYAIRNWLVHEGQSIGSVRLFHSDNIEDGLRLHGDAVSYIEKICNISRDGNSDPERCCLRDRDNPWRDGQDKDLHTILRCYNGEVDHMLAGLLKWSTDSFVGQFTAFSERDRALLNVGAVISNS